MPQSCVHSLETHFPKKHLFSAQGKKTLLTQIWRVRILAERLDEIPSGIENNGNFLDNEYRWMKDGLYNSRIE